MSKNENKQNWLIWLLVFFIAFSAFLVLDKFVSISDKTNQGQTNQGQTGSDQPTVVKVSIDDDPYIGEENAPVTIIEFSDFQCPYSSLFYSQTEGQLIDQYVKTGQVKLVYRDFPLSFHQNAEKAAEAGECADEQGKFWAYHDLLFERQSDWVNLKEATVKFESYAQELGLETTDFAACLENGQMVAEIQKDKQDGSSYGVDGTPAFFINGQLISGAQPFSVFQSVINPILK